MENYQSSFISQMQQISIMLANQIDILNKINDVVSSQSDFVELEQNDINSNQPYIIKMPTVNKLSYDVNLLAESFKKFMALDQGDTTFITVGNSEKKIKAVDLYKEPSPISNLNIINTFKTQTNWFFEGMMNPMLKVGLDLNDKVDDNVNKILSRRYIVKFQKYDDGSFTTKGSQAYQDFYNTFLNTTNIDLNTFLNWYKNPNNTGVINNLYPEDSMDEQIFDISLRESIYTGNFDVLQIEVDDVNSKIWYVLRDDKYYDKNTQTRKSLANNDEIILNKKGSVSRWKIVEVSNITNNTRIAIEQIEGLDIVPVGSQVIQIYSDFSTNKIVDVSVGYDEYNVVFVKTINSDNNMISSQWSDGSAFYTNDLLLENDSNVNLLSYYNDNVYNYGDVLKDLVEKKIPSKYGLTPNIPVLNASNFKVIQTNSYLNDTKENDKIKELNAKLSKTKSEISVLDTAITKKQAELSIKNYANESDRVKSNTELSKLQNRKNEYTKTLSTTANQITSSKLSETVKPVYELQGFWEFPEARTPDGMKAQEVIGFYYEYRKSSKLNNTNTTQTVEMSTSKGRVNASISNWLPIYTDIRKRVYNTTTNVWEWSIEDISDADTPNVNQLRIPILANEKIEIRIKSISEVGYPETKLMSDFSDILTYSFPDNLNIVGDENETILKAASQEELIIQVNDNLDSKGYSKHLEQSFIVNNDYIAHKDDIIMTSFKDDFGAYYKLNELIKVMLNKITVLEETVLRYKGELRVSIFKGNVETKINNSSVLSFMVECEDYGVRSGTTNRQYVNSLYVIKDYVVVIKNVSANNPLGFLTSKKYDNISFFNSVITPTIPIWVNGDNTMYKQVDNQFIYQKNFDDNTALCSGGTTDLNFYNILKSGYNLGHITYGNAVNINSNLIWCYNTVSVLNQADKFGCTVNPTITNNINELVDTSENKLKVINAANSIRIPLNLYFRFEINNTVLDATDNTTIATNTNKIINKKLKFYLDPENLSRSFEFTINFSMKQFKNSNITSTTEIPIIIAEA